MKKKIEVGDLVAIVGYGGDNFVRPVRVLEVGARLIKTECLVRSSAANKLYRNYSVDKIKSIKLIKVD